MDPSLRRGGCGEGGDEGIIRVRRSGSLGGVQNLGRELGGGDRRRSLTPSSSFAILCRAARLVCIFWSSPGVVYVRRGRRGDADAAVRRERQVHRRARSSRASRGHGGHRHRRRRIGSGCRLKRRRVPRGGGEHRRLGPRGRSRRPGLHRGEPTQIPRRARGEAGDKRGTRRRRLRGGRRFRVRRGCRVLGGGGGGGGGGDDDGGGRRGRWRRLLSCDAARPHDDGLRG